MEITLEKIELVKDRTGVSYAEAKEALEAADGSVVDAIISIEETIDRKDSRSFSSQGTAVLDNSKYRSCSECEFFQDSSPIPSAQ